MVKKSIKRLISGMTVLGLLFSMITPMANAVDNGTQVNAVDYSKVPKLLITELVPDSANVSSADAYEFIEVYNNTNKPMDFKDYNLVYRYPGTVAVWPAYNNGNPNGSIPIPSQSSIVLWVMNSVNKTLTEADFNNNYHTNLKENTNLFRVDGGGGMVNGPAADKPRDLVIQDKSGIDISIASYQNDNQTLPDKGIFYQYPTDGTKNMVMYGSGTDSNPATATPGVVDSVRVPPVPLNFSEPPVIDHTPVTQADQKNDLIIQAQVANTEQEETVTAAVYYQTGTQTSYETVDMIATGNNHYQAAIPKSKLSESLLKYYVQANDGFNTVKTDVYNVNVAIDNSDYSKVPPLLVTEVVPDSTNVGSADGYEFIEIYNNTDQPVNFKDYKMVYRYTDSGPSADVIWPADKEDVIIPSKSTLVFWIINNQNTNATVADFNANYNSNLVEGTNLVRIHSDGMANAANRGLVIATNTGTEISSVYYVSGDSKANKGILYKFPTDGSKTLLKYSSALVAATPGTMDQVQVPNQVVNITPDTFNPTVTDLTNRTEIDQSKDLEIIGEAKDDKELKTVVLYYKTDKQSNYSKHYLKESFADTFYHYTIYSPELIGGSYLDYYFVASDGTNEITTGTKRITIVGGADHSNLRLNLKDGEVIAKTKVIKGTGEGLSSDDLKLAIDGNELTQSTYHAVEHDAYFAFDVTGVNYYFKNGVTQGKEILSIFQDPINSYTTLSIPFQADRLKEGSNVISIRAGSKASPFDDRVEENKDDFEVKNVRLVFDDGTIIYDVNYNDPAKVIKMGDSTGKNPVVDFNFVIPDSQLASKAYVWNTALINDGTHQVSLSNANMGTNTSNVMVDNTAPVIQPSIEEGIMYRGAFTLDAVVSDAVAGVDKVEATLDEKPVTLPKATSSAELQGGAHVFSVKATDKVGNVTNVTVNFQVPNEIPVMPEQIAPGQEAIGVDRNAVLSVKVTDPMNDDMNVSFNQGFKYDASTQEQFAGYRHASDTEPPKQEKPEGEIAFTKEDYEKISAPDGNYLVDDSVEKFPYQRFEISLDESIQGTDSVEINWKGKSLEGRKVTLYAWSPSQQVWSPLKTTIAGSGDFELQAHVTAGDFANNHKIQVMVQDEIAVTQTNNTQATPDYDFSFVWMSDTQYYSKSFPYIYQDIVKWIADHKEDNKIKYVIHTGDIVDNADQEYQWIEADKDMKVLENAQIPYGVLAGNHDVGHQNNDYSYYDKWFGEDRFKDQPTYGESYDNNRGHYDLVSSNGNDFIVVYMGWGYGDKEIDWINEVLKKYPNRKAILNFHEFMLVSNNRAPMADKVFERVIKPNKNVIAALSGHYHDAQLKVDPIDDNGDGIADRNVYQMLADYQGAPEGGLGYIRLMQFDMAHGKINMKTYSPYLNDYNYYDPAQYPGKDEFSISLDLQPVTKRVATDYFGVNVYTANTIGSVDHVKSGQMASVVWRDLAPNTGYQWYAVAADIYGGRKQSDIWKFTTGTVMAGPADLTALSLSSGIPNEPFTASTTSYTQSVANSIDGVTVTPTAADAAASVMVNGMTVTSGQASGKIPLNVGGNIITVVVTAADSSTKTYTILVTRMSNNALLSNLAADLGMLNPVFSSSQPNYDLDVSNTVSSLNLFLTKANQHETLAVTGAVYSSVTGNVYTYKASNLIVGSNPIQIIVTAEDGTKNSYNLKVNRAPEVPVPSSNADLSVLTLSSGVLRPAFAPEKLGYTSDVDYRVSSFSVTASVYDSNAAMKVNGVLTTSGQASGTIQLSVGNNPITIVVTAQNGIDKKTYNLNVNRGQEPSEDNGSSSPSTSSDIKVTSTDGKITLPAGKTGEVSLGDEFKISIPADASGKELKLTIEKVLDTQKLLTDKDILASPVYEVLKNFSENFSKPVTLTFAFDQKSLKSNQKASVFYFDEVKKEWVEVGGKANGDHIVVEVNHFTKYAVMAVGQSVEEPTKPTISLSDISGHWAEANIKQAVSRGIVFGYPEGTFKPNHTVTRAEFAVMLMNTLKPQVEGTALTFADTAKVGAWATKAVAQAVQTGVINGYEDDTFRPDAEITRAEMAAMLAKAQGQTVDANATTDFADDKDIPAWAKGAVSAIKKLSLVEGKGNNEFAPKDKTTRAEAVTVLLKMLAQKK